jgi:hypothetical protein
MRTLPRPARRVTCPDCSPAATLPRPTPRPAQKPVSALDTCSLRLTIRGTDYTVRVLAPEPGSDVTHLVRLSKADGPRYYVARHADGSASCDCADFTFRRADVDPKGCKHCRSLVAVGLLGSSILEV